MVVVVVRPDQYVANVLPLSATAELAEFFAGLRSAPKAHEVHLPTAAEAPAAASTAAASAPAASTAVVEHA